MRFLPMMFLPLFASAQQGWLVVALQADLYSSETSWLITDENGFVIEESPGVIYSNSYSERFVFLEAGEYDFTIYDSYGDGICCGYGEGWFSLGNPCGLDTAVYDFGGSELTIPFEILPCPPPIFGCMDPGALDYNPWANAPGPCSFPPEQCDEGENNIIITVTPDTYAGEISWDLMTFPDGEIVADGSGYTATGVPVIDAVCLPVGTEFKVNVYDTYGDGMCGSCFGGVDGNLSVTTLCGDTLYYVGDSLQYSSTSSDIIEVEECVLPVPQGCTDPLFVEYDHTAVIDDGSCETEVILGCTDESAINYNPDANTMDTEDSCYFTLTLTDGAGDGWFGSWIGVVQGDEIFGPFTMFPIDEFEKEIQIPLYSGEAVDVIFFTQGNAETTAAQCGFYFDGPNGVFMEAGTNPWTDAIIKFPFRYTGVPVCSDFCIPAVEGCTDSTACNYDSEANVSASCTYPIEYYDCNNACVNDTDADGVCDELEIVGCQDPTAFNYNSAATDPGDCEEVVFGCMDPTQYNYNPEANTDNGGCIPFIYGCTIPAAINYDPLANTDNGSCEMPLPGCMDPDAANYNPYANIPENEECLYDAGCITGPGEPYWANDYCYSWVIEVDPYCCEEAWDEVCIDMYQYCSDGVTSIEEWVMSFIKLYPNPTNGVINFKGPIGAFADVYSASGQLLVSTTSGQQIDLTSLSNGLYEVVVNYKGRIVVERIIKQ